MDSLDNVPSEGTGLGIVFRQTDLANFQGKSHIAKSGNHITPRKDTLQWLAADLFRGLAIVCKVVDAGGLVIRMFLD